MNSFLTVQTPILVVDDDIWITRLILQRLSRKDFNIESVTSGQEAIAWIENHPESIILIDYLLEDMTAYEVLTRIDMQDRFLEFIVMTSIEDIKIAVMMTELGVFDFIIKSPEFLATLPMVLKKVDQYLAVRKQLKIPNVKLKVISS
ncbi:MAG: response regulator [Candidatus Marinimicrobia bacterium]|nr:response regulator [Candidatus Neomarinimicrobiota bacterium]MBL7047061.1 response regulator [Candidatus Neomarinimicrobiota bacterium]